MRRTEIVEAEVSAARVGEAACWVLERRSFDARPLGATAQNNDDADGDDDDDDKCSGAAQQYSDEHVSTTSADTADRNHRRGRPVRRRSNRRPSSASACSVTWPSRLTCRLIRLHLSMTGNHVTDVTHLQSRLNIQSVLNTVGRVLSRPRPCL